MILKIILVAIEKYIEKYLYRYYRDLYIIHDNVIID